MVSSFDQLFKMFPTHNFVIFLEPCPVEFHVWLRGTWCSDGPELCFQKFNACGPCNFWVYLTDEAILQECSGSASVKVIPLAVIHLRGTAKFMVVFLAKHGDLMCSAVDVVWLPQVSWRGSDSKESTTIEGISQYSTVNYELPKGPTYGLGRCLEGTHRGDNCLRTWFTSRLYFGHLAPHLQLMLNGNQVLWSGATEMNLM